MYQNFGIAALDVMVLDVVEPSDVSLERSCLACRCRLDEPWKLFRGVWDKALAVNQESMPHKWMNVSYACVYPL